MDQIERMNSMHYVLLVGGGLPTEFTYGKKFTSQKGTYISLKNEENVRLICRYLNPGETWERNCYLFECREKATLIGKGAGVSIIGYPLNRQEEEDIIQKISSR